jgi:uncharacterized protein YjiS (DUF1127 family)
MKNLRLVTECAGAENPGNGFDHKLVVETGAGFIDRITAVVKNRIEAYKAEARRERETGQVMQMSDSMLKDIGLTLSDQTDLESGLTSLGVLNVRRENYRRQFE